MATAAQAAHRSDGGQQVNMKKYGVYGTDYGGECQHVLQQTPAAWLVLRNKAIVVVHP